MKYIRGGSGTCNEGRVLHGCDDVGQQVTRSKAWTIPGKQYLKVAEIAIAPQPTGLQMNRVLTRVRGRCGGHYHVYGTAAASAYHLREVYTLDSLPIQVGRCHPGVLEGGARMQSIISSLRLVSQFLLCNFRRTNNANGGKGLKVPQCATVQP
jgi:hypothetical protein